MTGCPTLEAENGAEGLTMLQERRPCLVILDLMMPVMSGQELLELMQKDEGLASIPVVISTSAPEQAPRGVPVVKKPVDIDAIWGHIRGACVCGAGAHDAEPEKH